MPSIFNAAKGKAPMPSTRNGADGNGTAAGAGAGANSDPAPPSYDASADDEAVADGRTPADLRVPPSEDEVAKVNLTEAFDKLNLGAKPKFPDVDTCLAHLKLLFAIQAMKEEVGYTDGLWNIWDTRADTDESLASLDEIAPLGAPERPGGDAQQQALDKKLAILSKLREKRWAIFLARAVDRYEAWWTSMQLPGAALTEADMLSPASSKYAYFVHLNEDLLAWNATNLPPLGKCVRLLTSSMR